MEIITAAHISLLTGEAVSYM